MSAPEFVPEFGRPTRLDAGIWQAIRPRTQADKDRDQRHWREQHKAHALASIARLPTSFHTHIAEGWDARYGIPIDATNGSPVAKANAFARESYREFGDARAAHAYDESAIRDHAENYASMCARMQSLEHRELFASWFGITPPAGQRVTRAGAIARLDDPLWWRRQLRKVWTRRAEDAMRRAGVIRKGKAPYASDEAVRHRAGRQRRTREWLQSRVMVNGEGEQLDLIKLHDKSLANPALRRGEFMCRLRGFEEIAHDLEHVGIMVTLTAPSAFHAQLSKAGLNPRYKRQTVRDAQAWMRKMWARARAKLARLSIQIYGFRIAEPHHDGTPHWHMLLFVAGHHAETLRRVLTEIWLSEFSDEPGADHVRCAFTDIDASKGSAIGYLAKYVAKNIDGAGEIGAAEDHETGKTVASGLDRVAAWASVHGIRQFQQLGGPPVGLWRECRRARDPVESPLERVRKVVSDEKDWAGFIRTLAGHGSETGASMRVLSESSEQSPVTIDLTRASRRVRCVSEKYRRQVTPPMIRVRRLAKKQWRNKHGPRVAWDKREARYDEMPAAWLDKMHPRRADVQGREVLGETRYGEAAGERAAGVVAVGLLGRWASLETRPFRWRIEKCQRDQKQTPFGKPSVSDADKRSQRPRSGSCPQNLGARDLATNCHSGVMNPPAPAARGAEAGNPIALNAAGDIMGPWDSALRGVPRKRAGGAGPASSVSFWSSLPIFSPLGPVAITVRESENRDFSWIATIPYRPVPKTRLTSGAAGDG